MSKPDWIKTALEEKDLSSKDDDLRAQNFTKVKSQDLRCLL